MNKWSLYMSRKWAEAMKSPTVSEDSKDVLVPSSSIVCIVNTRQPDTRNLYVTIEQVAGGLQVCFPPPVLKPEFSWRGGH